MKHTIRLSEQTYHALERQAARSQRSVEVLVKEWLGERLELERCSEPEPVEYPESAGNAEVLRETRAADQETITLELPSAVYDDLRELAEEHQVDLVRELTGLVTRARLLQVPDARIEEEQAPTGSDLLRRIVSMAQDLGIDDLAEQHDHYLYGTEKQ